MLKQRQFTLRARAKVPNRPPPQLLSAMSLIFPTKMVSLSLLITKIRFRHVPKIFTSKVCWCAHEKHLTIICLAEATIPAEKKLLGHNPMSALARVSKNQCDNDIKINTQKLACNLNEVTAAAAMFFGLRLVIGFGKMSIRSNDAVNRRYARVYECVCVRLQQQMRTEGKNTTNNSIIDNEIWLSAWMHRKNHSIDSSLKL